MADLKLMYEGVTNSPNTYLKEPLASGGSIIYVIDSSVFGTLPNLAVIGDDQTAETVLIKNIRSDGGFDVDRAVEGVAKDWANMTVVARNFTNYDYEQLRENIQTLNDSKVEIEEGKTLSSNDYTNESKAKVDAIPENPIYTDTIYDDSELENRISEVENREDKDTTYDVATTTTNGLMSSADKVKLDGVETGAQKNTITSVQGRTGAVTISKSDVGLGSVNNVAITQAQVTKINELNYTRAMTEAQYNALSTSEKNRTDVWYGIYKE